MARISVGKSEVFVYHNILRDIILTYRVKNEHDLSLYRDPAVVIFHQNPMQNREEWRKIKSIVLLCYFNGNLIHKAKLSHNATISSKLTFKCQCFSSISLLGLKIAFNP